MLKLNSGRNFIFGSDVTLSGNNIGKTIDDVLDNQERRISKLESNTKWLYKYGGIGSGGSSSGSSNSATWKAILTCQSKGGKILSNGDEIDFGSVGTYTFKIQLYNVGDTKFEINWQYGSAANNGTVSKTDSPAIGTTEIYQSFTFDMNSSLNIIITDNLGSDPVSFSISYIVVPYNFSAYYVYADTEEKVPTSDNNNIYMSSAKSRGIKLALEYSINTDMKSIAYQYLNWDGTQVKIESKKTEINGITILQGVKTTTKSGEKSTQEIVTDSDFILPMGSSDGKILIPVIDDESDLSAIQYLSNNSNCGSKEFTVDFDIILKNSDGSYESISQIDILRSLIPTDLYLKVTTDSGSTYEGYKPSSYNKRFSIGTTSFYVVPYNNDYDDTRNYKMNVYYNYIDSENGETTASEHKIVSNRQLSDQEKSTLDIQLKNYGENPVEQYLRFELTLNNTTKSFVHYIKVNELSKIFSWYPSLHKFGDYSDVSPVWHANYYNSINCTNINGLTQGTILKKTMNDTKTYDTYSFNNSEMNKSSINQYDVLLSFGVQYSKLNNTDVPIAAFIATNSNSSNGIGSVYIYQDKVVITTGSSEVTSADDSCEIFLDEVDKLQQSSKDNYHLISIYRRFQTKVGESTYYRSIEVYIDGILEGTLEGFKSQNKVFDSFRLYKGNYYVDLIEYSLFENNSETITDQNLRTYLTECDIAGYYYAYITKVHGNDVDNTTQSIYEAFSKFEKCSNGFIKCTESLIKDIASKTEIPILLMQFSDTTGKKIAAQASNPIGTDNFLEWIKNVSYGQEDSIENVDVNLMWSAGDGRGLNDVQYNGSSATFQTTIQGSSTRQYYCKNFELYAPVGGADYSYVYSPNFNESDTTTFLPESSFTLKADVVDSSHSNNTVMGKFINDVSTKFSSASSTQTSKYRSFIKNCLTGFPILLFLETKYYETQNKMDEDSKKEVKEGPDIQNFYFLGIYNFNLGRGSYFNLGYKDLSQLDSLNLQSGFNIYKLDTTTSESGFLKPLQVAEIQDNDKFWDFSQYGSTVLFGIDGVDGDAKMFGDFIDGSSTSNYEVLKEELPSAIKQVSLAGGYIFDTLQKKMSTSESDNYGYNYKYSKEGYVPNYRYQVTRYKSGTTVTNYFTQTIEDGKGATQSDLDNSIVSYELDDGNSTQVLPRIDYQSLIEYYTFCMAFGLVDSVQKNLNLKSWNYGKTYYLAFYDMDTCLGINNDGDPINYYAFSDYWKTGYTGDINSTPALNQAEIIRDYAPSDVDSDEAKSLFDIPTSYLFAIAKYGKLLSSKGSELADNPNNLWLKWRKCYTGVDKSTGCLESADSFITRYYKHHLDDVPLAAFNFNYIYKYLRNNNVTSNTETNTPGFVNYDWKKFHGRRLASTRNWLSNRLHILDAYFNLSKVKDVMVTVNSTAILAPQPSDTVDTSNEDIYIIHDAFSEDGVKSNRYSQLDTTLTIKAIPSSPIIIEGKDKLRYLTLPNYLNQTLRLTTDGTQNYKIGGSSAWTYVNTINPFFYGGKLTVNSDYFETIYGNIGTCSNWNINAPSLQQLSLTSGGYSGALEFTTTKTTGTLYPNLFRIDISNTAINLVIDGLNLLTLTAKDMQSGSSIRASNITSLTSVDLYGNFTQLAIPTWKTSTNTIYLPTNYLSNTTGSKLNCPTMTITNDPTQYPGYTLHIRNNSTLTTLTIQGIETLTVSDCPNLKNIIIQDTNILKNITVDFTTEAKNEFFGINCDLYDSEEDASEQNPIIDLGTQSALESIKFTNCIFSKVILDKGFTVVDDTDIDRICADSSIQKWTNYSVATAAQRNAGTNLFVLDNSGYNAASDSQISDTSVVLYYKNSHAYSLATATQISSKKSLYTKTSDDSKKITLNSSAFSGCSSLRYIDTYNGTSVVIHGSGVFQNCCKYNMMQSDGKARTGISISEDISDLSYTFGISNESLAASVFTIDDMKYFLSLCTSDIKENITNISNLFRRQSAIYYTISDAISDYNTNAKCSIKLDFPNCSSIGGVIYQTNINFINRYMFEGLATSSVIKSISFNNVLPTNRTLTVTTDFLYELIEKISSLQLNEGTNGWMTTLLKFVELTGTYDSATGKNTYTGSKDIQDLKLADMFCCPIKLGLGNYDYYREATEEEIEDSEVTKYIPTSCRTKVFDDIVGTYSTKEFQIAEYREATSQEISDEDSLIYFSTDNSNFTVATSEQRDNRSNLFVPRYFNLATSSDKENLVANRFAITTDESVLQNENVTKFVKVSQVQYERSPLKLTSIQGLEPSHKCIVNSSDVAVVANLTNLFNYSWKAANTAGLSLNSFLYSSGETGFGNLRIKDGSLDYLFYNIKPVSITRVLNAISYVDDDGNKIDFDLYKLFDYQNNLDKATNLFADLNYDNLQNISRYITIGDFHKIWDGIITNAKNLVSIQDLFRNAKVITLAPTGDVKYDFYLMTDENSSEQNTSIKSINRLFENMIVCSDEMEPLYLSLTHNFLRCMPKLTNLYQTFYGIYLYHTLPFDFFNKRVEKTQHIWVKNEDSEEPIEAYRHYFEYTKEINNLDKCFYNAHCPFDLDGFDPKDSYNNDISGNSSFVPEYITEEEVYLEDSVQKSRWVKTDTQSYYNYDDPEMQNEKTLRSLTEITDCDVETNYTEKSNVTYGSGQNGTSTTITLVNYIFSNQGDSDYSGKLNRLFISPDILYGVKDSTTVIDNMFANQRNSYTFTGAIPKNLLKNCKSASFIGMFQNLNILPQKFDELLENGLSSKYYTFVPPSFTTNSSLESSFNFKVFLPPSATDAVKINYCILLDSSIPDTTSTLKGSLPSNMYEGLYRDVKINTGNNGQYNFASFKHGLTYALILTKKTKTQEKEGSEGEYETVAYYESGFNIQDKFTSLKLDGLINSSIVRILSGRLFTTDCSSTINGKITDTYSSNTYVINIGSWGYFSASFSEYFPSPRGHFMPFFTEALPYINRTESILNTEDPTGYSYTNVTTIK